MSRKARSARGELIDFDLLAIKQQLATTPVPVGVNERRKFIDEKDGIRTKEVALEPTPDQQEIPSALNIALEAAQQSAAASDTKSKSKSKD